MPFLFAILSFALVSSANASEEKLVDCTATEVFISSYLEESFSVEEDPSVRVTIDETGSKSAWLGSSYYRETDGDVITPEPSVGFDQIYTLDPSHQVQQYLIVVSGDRGKLFGRDRKNRSQEYGEYNLIASLMCE